MKIKWEESFSLGMEELDNQHREMFSRFNDLITACTTGSGREEALRMVEYLNSYAAAHFTKEEELQHQYGYPNSSRHKEEHDAFVRELSSLEQQFREQGPVPRLVATTNHVVAVWLIDHISRLDAEFARYLSIVRR
jgi:hemerythrin